MKHLVSLSVLALFGCLPSPVSADTYLDYTDPSGNGWHDNYHTDTTVESRRTDHMSMRFGTERVEGFLTEQLFQGILQFCENTETTWLKMGFHDMGGYDPVNKYKGVLQARRTFMYDADGNAVGFTNGPGAPGIHMPCSYFGYRDPNGVTPHEMGHRWGTTPDNTTGMPGFGAQGPGLSESFANYMEQQQLAGYPWDSLNMGMPMGHAVNYYGDISIFTHFMETYGPTFFNALAYAPNVANDDLIQKAIRVDTSGAADKTKDIYDGLGMMNAKMLNMDFWNHRISEGRYAGYGNPSRFDDDLTRPGYFFYRIPMVQQPGVAGGPWYRPEWTCTPQTLSNNYIPLTITATGTMRTVTCDFRPVVDPVRGSNFRACFVAFGPSRQARYSQVWNAGVNSFTLADEETAVYLAVMACPKNLNLTMFHSDFTSDNVCMFPYRIKLTGATPKGWQWPAPTSGFSVHANGGGKKATTATVDAAAYIGPNAMVLGTAKVYGNSRIEDFALVDGAAVIGRSGQTDNPVVSGHAYVTGNAQVYGHAKIRDYAWVWGSAKVYENAIVMAHTMLQDGATIFGSAVLNQAPIDRTGFAFNGSFSGSYIVGGDISGGGTYTSGVYCEFPTPPTTDNKYQYLGYNFEKPGNVFAMDQYGMNHSFLMNSPQVVGDTVNGVTTKVLALDGASQYVELRPDAVDFADLTISAWVKWTGSAADQMIFSTGDGTTKVMSLTPKASATGNLQWTISNGVTTQYLNAAAPLVANTWTHVAVALGGNTGTLYVNGTVVDTNAAITIDPDQLHAPMQADWNFIGRGNTGNYFAGRIDEFRVYNKALILAEVAALQTDITAGAAPAADTTAPTPNAPTWLVIPTAAGATSIAMSATIGADPNGVFYYFTCTTDPTHDSGWIAENSYTDLKATPGSTYTYTIQMKDGRGNATSQSSPLSAITSAAVTTVPAPAPPAVAGSGSTAVTVTATAVVSPNAPVTYRFSRVGSAVTSGWTTSLAWTDTGLTSGTSYSYTVQAMDGQGNLSTISTTSATAVARDDSAPLMDPDSRMQFGTHPYVQLDKTIRMYCMTQAETNVQYYYECVELPAINSGWITTIEWITPVMANGTYNFRFRMRDKSPQANVSVWSATKSATVTTTNSYQNYTLSQLAGLPDDTLANFTGTVTQVFPTYYVVSDGTNTINVTPRATRSATEPMLINQNVTVRGHLWTYTPTPKRVTFATVRSSPAAGKIEFEDCDTLNEAYTVEYDPTASHSEMVGGWAKQPGWEMSVPNVAAANQIVIGYMSYGAGAGTISMYVNGTHAANITLPQSNTYTSVKQAVSIPAGATLMFRADAGDISPALDYLILSNNTIAGKVTNASGVGIAGATVYFSASPNASTTYSITATTDASGNYSQGMANGTWYVAVSNGAYNTSADQSAIVNNANVANPNIVLIANSTASGKVTKLSDGTAIAGATVYFTKSPTETATYSATTNATGDYTQSLQNGVWYVCAAATGYRAAPNQLVNVSGSNVTGINLSLKAFVRNTPRTADMLFSAITDDLPASGTISSWPSYYPAGQPGTPQDNPTAITLNGVKWEVNDTTASGDGFNFGNYTTIPVNGISVVAVCKPKRLNDIGGFQTLVNLLSLFRVDINRSTGELQVWAPGQGCGGVFIPDGQPSIISVVLQPNGTFMVWLNGDQVMNVTNTNPFTTLGPSWMSETNIGRCGDSWSAYQGQIGDVFVYKVALTDAERQLLEADMSNKFSIGAICMITPSAGTGGTISPSVATALKQGVNQTFTITPSPGYAVSQVTVDGVNMGAITSYTFSSVQTDHTIAATYVAMPNVTITASAGTGGSISPSGTVSALYNSNQTFAISRISGYQISTVLVDGVNNSAAVSSGTYTFSNVQADHTIAATYVPIVTYTITASAGSNGSISPGGAVVVDQGSSNTFTITPNTGYIVDTVTVDGSGVGAITTYTFTNVQAAHTIAATFKQSTLPAGTVGYWSFDNTLADGGPNLNTLQRTAGTVAYGPAKFGSNSLYLDGSTTLGTLIGTFPVGLPTGNNAYSVACFVKADPTSSGNGGWLGYGSQGGPPTLSMNFRMSGYTGANVYWWGNDQGGNVPNGGNFTTAWHSVVATYNGSTRILYIDGVSVANGTPSAPANVSNSQFVVGKTLGDANLKGWIDDLLIVNRALSATEAAAYNTYGGNIPITQYAITASAGTGGSITPSGAVMVSSGGTQAFAITPNAGYVRTNVLVDGVNNTAAASSGTYSFSNVTATHTISATFTALITTTATLTRHSGTTSASNYGTALGFDVAVSGSPAATGTVTLMDGGSGGTSLGSATLTSGTCTITSTTLTVGSHPNIVAVYAGDSRYAAATSSALSIQTVGQATPVVTITGTVGFTYNGSPQGPNAATTGGSTGAVTFSYTNSGGTTYGPISTQPTGAGNYTVTATVAADANYTSAASSPTAFTIAMVTPAVTVTGATGFTYNGSPQGPSSATTSPVSTGAVTFSYAGSGGTSYGPSSAQPAGAGSYAATAAVAADPNYTSASSSPTAFTIAKATPTLSVTNSPVFYNGSTQAAAVVGSVAGPVSNVKYNGSATVPSAAGTYAVTADFAPTDSADYNGLTAAAAGDFVINPPITTTAGTATATASGQTGITVTMPYTDDANSNNTYTLEYKFTSGSTWTTAVSNAAHAASPYTTTITGLTQGTSYDVRVTYNDTDGVTGTNPQTLTVVTGSPGIIELSAWSNLYHGTATTAQNLTYAVPAGSGARRVLLVAIASEPTGVAARTVTLTYGGQTLTPVSGDMATTTVRQHTALYYLNNAGLILAAANANPTTLAVRVSGGTTRMTDVFAAVYDGVDQTTAITDFKTYSNGTTVGSTFAFGTGLVVNAGNQAVGITCSDRITNTTLWTVSTYATNWSLATEQTSITTDAIRNMVTKRSIPIANVAADTSSTVMSGTSLGSMTALSLANAKATPTVMVINSLVTYNGSAQSATVNSSVAGSVSNVKYAGSATVPTTVGTYAVTADLVPTDSVNFTSLTSAAAGNLVIQKATPTVAVANSPVTYTGSPQLATVNGSVAGIASNVKYAGSATVPTSAGTYAVTADFVPTVSANYNNLTAAAAGNLVIQKATPTLAVANSPLTYNGSAQLATVTGSVPGAVSNVQYNGSATVPTTAGSYAVTADFAPTDSTNYSGLTTTAAGSLVIQKATPTLSVANSPVTYTTAPQSVTVNSSVAGAVSNVQYNGSATAPAAVGNYAVTANFAPSDSVNFNGLTSVAAGSLVIQKATPALVVANSPVTYNGSPQPATVNSAVAGTPANVKYNGSATVPTAAGNYAVTADFAPSDSANYTGLTAAAAGSWVIQKAAVIVTATGPNKTYGAALLAATGTVNFTATSAVSGEAVTGVTISPDPAGLAPTTAAGSSYLATPALATGTGGFLESNYQVTYNAYHGTVSKKALGVTATGPAKTYGAAMTAAASAANFTADATGVGSEVVTGVTLTPDAAGLSAATPVGSAYLVTPSLATGTGGWLESNYQVSYSAYQGTVAMAAASITLGNLAQTYDGTPKPVTVTIVPTELTANLTYNGVSDPPSAIGSYAVVATVNGTNYTGTASGTLVISEAAILAWQKTHFTTEEIAAGLAADAADPDGDGVTNLAEFAFNGDPRKASSTGMFATRVANGALAYTCAVRRGAVFAPTAGHAQVSLAIDGLVYAIEGSRTLSGNWNGVITDQGTADTAPIGSGLPDLTGSGWQYHTFSAFSGLSDKGFLRAAVAKP